MNDRYVFDKPAGVQGAFICVRTILTEKRYIIFIFIVFCRAKFPIGRTLKHIVYIPDYLVLSVILMYMRICG